ncbi:PepSY domain-containing protein [Micromonospora soli]|uniref:PepSY domain-containing protein n=1 Tax=Micromonospora sp. NBRC 110009 TaxID=3061627 RepID=UPI0026734121|nr:PepSY domain-containing protein [Micromonospora sp. NBRC 110009]WKT99830.1 PepSY domain-containing protein [Micromonospora sp. NBRC 110009]
MRRMSLVLAAAGGAAVLAVSGVALGVQTADWPTAGGARVAVTADDNPKPDDDPTSRTAAPTGTAGTPAATVSRERAGEIALARLGGGRIVEIEAELEHGRPVWSVKVARAGTTYEVKVARSNGAVVEVERRQAGDDGRRTDDRYDDHGGDRARTDDHGTDDRYDDHGGDRRGSDD